MTFYPYQQNFPAVMDISPGRVNQNKLSKRKERGQRKGGREERKEGRKEAGYGPAMHVVHTCNSSTGTLRQEDYECKVLVDYIE